jgi:hypothetical protein
MKHAKNFQITWLEGGKQVTQLKGRTLPSQCEAENDNQAIQYARDQAATMGIDQSKLTCTAKELATAGGQ